MTHSITLIASPDTAAPAGHYSPAAAYGGLVFISGQLPVRPDGTHIANADFETQAQQVMENFLAVAAAAGAAPNDIVKVTVYVADVAHWPAFNRIYAACMGAHRPARAVVPVPELHHGYLVEVEGIAVRGAR